MANSARKLVGVLVALSVLTPCWSQIEIDTSKAELLFSILRSQEFEEYKMASRQTTAFIRSGELDFEPLRNQLLADPDQMAAPSEEFLRTIPGALEYSRLSSREVRWMDSLDSKFGYLTLLSEDDLNILFAVYNDLRNQDLSAAEIESMIIHRIKQRH